MADSRLTNPSTARRGVSASEWRGRRILITGHSGFIGSWLSSALLHLGVEVHGFALDDDEPSRRRTAALNALGVTSGTGDIRDLDAVQRAMSAQPFDVVFHLAAQPLVGVGLRDPQMTLSTNIGGSINVLEAARLCEPRVLVHVSSDKCYRNRGWQWPYREVDDLGAGCPYSTSKAASELVFETYASLLRSRGSSVRAASVRFGNVIGGGDDAANRLVPDVMAALRAEHPITLRRPGAVRPWQHVLDVVSGLLMLAEALAEATVEAGEVYNFAPPADATVHELCTALSAAWLQAGGQAVPVRVDGDEWFPEEELLRLDGRKAAGALGWRHAFGLEESAKAIVEWDRAVSAGLSPMAAVLQQVGDFMTATDGSLASVGRRGACT